MASIQDVRLHLEESIPRPREMLPCAIPGWLRWRAGSRDYARFMSITRPLVSMVSSMPA